MKRHGIPADKLALFLLLASLPGCLAFAQTQQQTQQPATQGQEQKPQYTMAEYNAYQAAAKETDPQKRIKLLDDFVAKFPNSTLLPYVDQSYYTAYNQLKDYAKTIEYADKLLATGPKELGTQLEALYTRELAFNLSFNDKAPNAAEQATKARDAAVQGLKILDQLPKPANMTDEQFAEQKKTPAALFNYTGGLASSTLKDYKAAENFFKEAIKNDPKNGVSYYRLGLAYLQEQPPQSMEGFWALARAIALKVQGEAQVRDYLKKQLIVYEQVGCDSLADQQMNELLQLAATSNDRPAGFTIPSGDELNAIRQKSNILTILHDLQEGGDTAKKTWLAVCGSEFPEVVGKVIDANSTPDVVTLLLYTGATPEEMEKATTPNMEVKVAGQPEASRLQKDDGVRFAGTLVAYDPQPFMLRWEKGKVNPEDIPAEKAPAGQRKKRPIRKPPSR